MCSQCAKQPKVEAAGIEPASRDRSGKASTRVAGYLGLVASSPNRRGGAATSRERVLTQGVLDVTPGEPNLAAGSQASSAKALSRGSLLLGRQCEVFLGK